jgi:hypothetical protein
VSVQEQLPVVPDVLLGPLSASAAFVATQPQSKRKKKRFMVLMILKLANAFF